MDSYDSFSNVEFWVIIENVLNKNFFTIILSLVTPGKIRSLKAGVTISILPSPLEPLNMKKMFDVPASITSSP